jgi:hypothetical protein
MCWFLVYTRAHTASRAFLLTCRVFIIKQVHCGSNSSACDALNAASICLLLLLLSGHGDARD